MVLPARILAGSLGLVEAVVCRTQQLLGGIDVRRGISGDPDRDGTTHQGTLAGGEHLPELQLADPIADAFTRAQRLLRAGLWEKGNECLPSIACEQVHAAKRVVSHDI